MFFVDVYTDTQRNRLQPHEKSAGCIIDQRKEVLLPETHPNDPGHVNREHGKSQKYADGDEKGGSFGSIKVAVHAFPDSSDEQRNTLLELCVPSVL